MNNLTIMLSPNHTIHPQLKDTLPLLDLTALRNQHTTSQLTMNLNHTHPLNQTTMSPLHTLLFTSPLIMNPLHILLRLQLMGLPNMIGMLYLNFRAKNYDSDFEWFPAMLLLLMTVMDLPSPTNPRAQ